MPLKKMKWVGKHTHIGIELLPGLIWDNFIISNRWSVEILKGFYKSFECGKKGVLVSQEFCIENGWIRFLSEVICFVNIYRGWAWNNSLFHNNISRTNGFFFTKLIDC